MLLFVFLISVSKIGLLPILFYYEKLKIIRDYSNKLIVKEAILSLK